MTKRLGRPPKAATERRRSREIGNRRSQMNTPQLKGFATRWVNDVKSKIHDMTVEDDWDFVLKDEIKVEDRVSVGDPDIQNVLKPGERVSRPVGRVGNVPNATAFLLKKKQQYYDADQKAAQDRITETEKQLYRPAIDERRGNLKIT